MLVGLVSGEDPLPYSQMMPSHFVLTQWKGVRELSGVSFITALIPCMKAPPLGLNHLPKAPTSKYCPLGVRISTYESKGDTDIHPTIIPPYKMPMATIPPLEESPSLGPLNETEASELILFWAANPHGGPHSDLVYFISQDRCPLYNLITFGRHAFSLVTGPPKPHFFPSGHFSLKLPVRPLQGCTVAPEFIEPLSQRRKGT